ncbi:MAG: hypothetical protein HQK73_07765, partial [Desulfamplus sp.]|nr:hypothetical protein [Desulfamplus sp.]
SSDYGNSVYPTSDGGFIVTGYTSSIGAGGNDVYLIKTDSNGNELWSKTFGGKNDDYGRSVYPTRDGGFIVTGYTSSIGAGESDVYLIKTDSNGNEIWSKTLGGKSSDYGNSVYPTSDGGFIITGNTSSIGAGSSDVYLIKTDSNGNELWSKTLGGKKYDYSYSVYPTSDGGFIITGYTFPDNILLIKTDKYGEAEVKVDECGVINGDNSICIGCDGILNSGLKLDECGVCGGDGSSCKPACVKCCSYAWSCRFVNQYGSGTQTGNSSTTSYSGCLSCTTSWALNQIRNDPNNDCVSNITIKSVAPCN